MKKETVFFPETLFLTGLFQRFHEQKIDYCVLRHQSLLPVSHGGSDIDILFSPKFFEKADRIIVNTARDHGGFCISKIRAHRVISRAFCGRSQTKQWWGVRFDTFSYVGTNGCDVLPVPHVLNRSGLHNGIHVAKPTDDAIAAFIKEIIGAGRTRKNYRQLAVKAFSQEESIFTNILRKNFGSRAFENFLLPLLRGKPLDLKKASTRLKAGFMKTTSIKVLLARLIDIFHRSLRFFKKPGIFIAFLGTDGSGKSTVIRAIQPTLESTFHSPGHHRHFRPGLLPSLARLFGRPEAEGAVTRPHASRPSGFLGSLSRLFYYSLDYVFGYWFTVFPILVRQPSFIVFDRYFYDYYIDPRRSRIDLPSWIIRLCGIFIPAPDVILCLGSMPEIIQSRKPELPFDEVARQVNTLKNFCQSNKRAVWIDTSCSIEESADQALAGITSKLAARYGR